MHLNILSEANPISFSNIKDEYNKIALDFINNSNIKDRLLNELDLNKLFNFNTLSKFTPKNSAMNKLLYNIPLFIENHALKDADERFIKPPLSSYITTALTPEEHIEDIIFNCLNIFKLKNSNCDLIGTLFNELKKKYIRIKTEEDSKNINNDIFVNYNDDKNDLKVKFSIYRLFKKEIIKNSYVIYMLEGALALTLSVLSYKNKSLYSLKNDNNYLWDEFIRLNARNNYIDLNTINLLNPVINITGYTTIFKKLDFLLRYEPQSAWNQDKNSKDIYTYKTERTVSYSYGKDIILNNSFNSINLFKELIEFETRRPKHESEKRR